MANMLAKPFKIILKQLLRPDAYKDLLLSENSVKRAFVPG